MISIVIPNYNGKNYLKGCIESIFKQTDTSEYVEVIIIDNASTDDDYKWVLTQYPSIRWVALGQNYGFSYAVNQGIKIATGEYIILLNNDTELLEDFIEELYREIRSDDTIFSVCSQMIQYYNTALIDDAGDNYNLLGWAYKRGDGEKVGRYDKKGEVFSTCAGAAIYRRAVFEEIGYFDEHFFAYMEDVDISYRARVYGYKNMYCAKAKVLHIGSATSGSKYNAFKVRLAARNNIYVPYKNMPIIQLVLNMPFLVIGYMIKYVFFKKMGFAREYREGLIEGIRTIHKVKKVPFEWACLLNYTKIEGQLIYYTIHYLLKKILEGIEYSRNKECR